MSNKKERITKGLADTLWLTRHNFLGPVQAKTIRDFIRNSEERSFFIDKMAELRSQIEAMPTTGHTDGQGDQAIAHLHYFNAASDWWITEKDIGDPEDKPEEAQWQAYGMVSLNGWEKECGYICLPELFKETRLGYMVELDLHWTPTTLAEIKGKTEAPAPIPPEPAIIPFPTRPDKRAVLDFCF